jgi:hypothetical protein
MLDFEESKMRESVKPITIAEVTKATTEYAPDLNVTVELAREQVKTQTRSMAKARSISSLLRLPKNEKEEERFQTKSLHLVD